MIYVLYIVINILIALGAGLPKKSVGNNNITNNILLAFLFLIITYGIYNVNLNNFVDLNNYYIVFQNLRNLPISSVHESPFELVFTFFMWIIANLSFSFNFFLILAWGIIFYNLKQSINLLLDKNETVFIILTYLNLFIFFDYVLNVIRQGLAISFLILALSILQSDKNHKRKSFYLLLIIAPFFHDTALYGSLILLLLSLFKFKMKTIISIWLIFAVLFITDLNRVFSLLPISDISFYTSERVLVSYSQTNRLDFFLFTVFFAVVGIIIYYTLNNSKEYSLLLQYYLLMNLLFFALGFIGYSDRLAAYSWFTIVILLWKGIEQAKQYRITAFILLNSFIVLGILMGAYENINYILQMN